MIAQGWWILGGILLASLQLFALFLVAKDDDEISEFPTAKPVEHVRIVHKNAA